MHISHRFIKYYFISGLDAEVYLKDSFKIIVDKKTLQETTKNYRKIENEFVKQRICQASDLSIFYNCKAINILKKFTKNKSKLYYLNTALYRGVSSDIIANVLNSNFTDSEKNALFTSHDVEVYKSTIFSLDECSEEELKEIWKLNKTLFEFNNSRPIEMIQIECDLSADISPGIICNKIANLTYLRFQEKIISTDKNDQKDSLNFAKMALQATKDSAAYKTSKLFDGTGGNIDNVLNFVSDEDEYFTPEELS